MTEAGTRVGSVRIKIDPSTLCGPFFLKLVFQRYNQLFDKKKQEYRNKKKTDYVNAYLSIFYFYLEPYLSSGTGS